MEKTAIVVGASGMDGESLCYFLLQKGYNVVGTYRKNTRLDISLEKQKYKDRIDFSYCEISDYNSVNSLIKNTLQKYGKIDEIYLLAAQSHVGFSFIEKSQTVITNGMSAYNFLESILQLTPSTRFYFAATSELLGGDPNKCPFDENSEYECRSPYSIGKELGTRWVKYYQQTHDIFACYGVLFNHSNCSRDRSFFIRKLTDAAAKIALGKQDKVKFGNLGFARDEHWSDFGVEMMWKMLQQEKPETFVICRGKATTGYEFIEHAFGYFNLEWRKYVELDKDLLRPNEVVKLEGDPAKAIKKLGWRPNRMSIKDHMTLMCQYDYDLNSGLHPQRPNVFELFP